MHPSPPSSVSHLDWSHIGFGLALVVFISTFSQLLHLHVGASLAIAALRCIAQLTTMGIVLQHILLVTKKLWAVAETTYAFFPSTAVYATRTVLTFPSASEHSQHGRTWCVSSIEAVIFAFFSRSFMVESHHQGPEKVSTYGQPECAHSSFSGS